MAKYNSRVCTMCGTEYVPTSPNQKSCEKRGCRSEIRRRAERGRYKKRQQQYCKVCVICGVEFKTTDSRRRYCGSAECEKERNLRSSRKTEESRRIKRIPERKQYYLKNKEGILSSRKKYYREVLHPDREVREGQSTFKLKYDFIKQVFSAEKYTLLDTEYVNNHTKLNVTCPKGHPWVTTVHLFKDGGIRCVRCTQKGFTSKAEKELLDFVESVLPEGVDVFSRYKYLISPYEVDIYIPAKNLAIEYCGLYWHSEVAGGKPKKYHYEKMIACNEKGVRLITIFEDEYLNMPEVVKSRIQNALKVHDRRFFARKCELKVVDKKECAEFLSKYHLQGKGFSTKIGWGLYFDNELLAVLTAGSLARAHVARGKKVLEIKRFASLPGVNIVGGGGKLFSAAKKYALANGYEELRSYCDMRWASLKPIYEVLFFELKFSTKFTPHYVKEGKRFRNQGLRKTEAEKKLVGETEWSLRKAQNFDRIWDVGHRTYVFDL